METIKTLEWKIANEKDFDQLPSQCAVYLIVAETSSGENIVFYTGQTNDIKRRLKEHWSDNEQNKMIKNIIKKYKKFIFAYYAIDHENALDAHERFLFNFYEPQAQTKAPDVEQKRVTLPSSTIKGKIKTSCFD